MITVDKTVRLKKFQIRLRELGIDVALLIHSRDVFYYCGTAQPCILVVTPNDYYLIVRRALDFVLSEIWIDPNKVISSGSFKEALSKLRELGVKKGKLGLETDIIPAELFFKISQIFIDYTPVNISEEILLQRMTKDEEEIELIKSACNIMKTGHLRVFDVLSEGITELELAAEIEYAHRKAGHEGVLSMRNFDFYISRGPLSSGENLFKVSGFSNTITGIGLSPAIPAGPSLRKIKKGDIVIVDIPTCYHGYHCDETRTYILGEPTPEVRSLFACLREISDNVLFSLKEGVKCSDLFDIAYNSACRLGVNDYFLGLNPRKGNFIGHGIGLDANEPPVLFTKSNFELRKNSVITIEIHLTHPEYGAVKLEDMVLIKENGHEVLSVTERELFVIDTLDDILLKTEVPGGK
ncbi:M24 family metallopeptidase [Desulfoscipio gibsoniae]|uniref:Xaa-Pro aminopeptidase n=1 Tax=Desulfoscipio gibsoniae DSM 7213 TaxID=767817 RepID=R4KPC8_9FIRM|nr:Xaa-Pro peptidase family protein [Desulfoscipio gibsoniae]AGL02440.1 Xaa-Pro aminopeptidase [Desulfoscipio gibsoniae DSM 7213]